MSKIRPSRLALVLAGAGTLATTVLVAPATPAFSVLSLYRVEATSTSDANTPKSQNVSCGSDDVVGLGGRVNSGGGDVLMTKMYANSNLDTVTVQGVEAVDTSEPWSVTAWAVCAPAGTVANLQLVETSSGSDPNDKVGIEAKCTGQGKKVFGAGFRLEEAQGKVAVDALELDPVNQKWVHATAHVHDTTVGDFTLTPQAICGSAAGQVFQSWDTATNTISPKTESTSPCPTGTQPSGVGAVLTGAPGDSSLIALEPHVTGSAVEATGREIGAFPSIWNMRVEEICVG